MVFSIKTPNPGDSRRSFFGLELARQLTKRKAVSQQLKVSAPLHKYNEVLAQIPEGSDETSILPYEPILLSGEYYIPPDDVDFNHLSSNIINGYHIEEPDIIMKQWGIAIDNITTAQAGRVLLSGVSWLNTESMSITPDTYTHINILDNQLVPGYNGRATILQIASRPHCLVELADRRSTLIGKTGIAGLDSGAEGTVTYYKPGIAGWDVTDIQIPAWTLPPNIDPDKWCILLPVEGRFFALELCAPV